MNYCNHQPKREVSASQIEMAIKAFTELKIFLITRSSHFLVRKSVSLYPDFTLLCRTVTRWAKGWYEEKWGTTRSLGRRHAFFGVFFARVL